MAEADLGEDIGGVDDIDWNMSFASGRRCLAEAIARRWLDLAGSLFYAPDYGKGLAAYLSASVAESEIAGDLEEEALKDERVRDVSVTVTRTGEELRINARLTDADGPFDFTVFAGALDARLVMENAS